MTTNKQENIKVTLNAIRKHSPCDPSWKRLLQSLGKTKADDSKVSIRHILDLLGLDDALWALCALPASMDSRVRLLVCGLVEPALVFANDPIPAKVVKAARDYAQGLISRKDLDAARDAAWEAAWDARDARDAWNARAAALAAARNARAYARVAALADARDAFDDARDAARDEQETIFRRWLDAIEAFDHQPKQEQSDE